MNKQFLNFTNIDDKNIHKMLEKDLNVEIYDKEKDDGDWSIGRTMDTCTARLSEIHGKIYLHLVSKNPCLFGDEMRIYSYDMIKKNVCKISQIQKNISEQTYKSI